MHCPLPITGHQSHFSMMRYLILGALLFGSSIATGGEQPAEIDSYESAFHFMIHDGAGFCLVCYTSVEKKPWGKEWEQLEIEATIVEVFRGTRKVGDRIEFRRVLDGKYGDISHLQGSLKFVRFDKPAKPGKKETYVDAQDPQAIFGYSEEFHKVAREHTLVKGGGDD